MNRREQEAEKMNKLARISIGFGNNVSFSEGIVLGSDDLDSGIDHGAKGMVIPWAGCKHIKIFVGSE